MAIIARRYRLVGSFDDELKDNVDTSASNISVGSVVIDIQVDDSLGGVIETMDEFMAEKGFVFIEQNPPTETSLTLRSPNGSLFEIQVTNAGAVLVVPI